jgi:prolyl-tRNA synthetase
VFSELKQKKIRVVFDDREHQKSGWKFNFWEQRGVPIRIEIGKKDLDGGEVRCCKRNDGGKSQIRLADISTKIPEILEGMHHEMYNAALQARLNHVKEVDNWKDFMEAIAGRNICLTPWCNV